MSDYPKVTLCEKEVRFFIESILGAFNECFGVLPVRVSIAYQKDDGIIEICGNVPTCFKGDLK